MGLGLGVDVGDMVLEGRKEVWSWSSDRLPGREGKVHGCGSF